MVRKGGLEPPRYCYRQPFKLDNLPRASGLTRILQTHGRQERAATRARDDFIRTGSHTAFPDPVFSRNAAVVFAGARLVYATSVRTCWEDTKFTVLFVTHQ